MKKIFSECAAEERNDIDCCLQTHVIAEYEVHKATARWTTLPMFEIQQITHTEDWIDVSLAGDSLNISTKLPLIRK